MLREFTLSDVLIMPSRKWIAFVVESNHKDATITEPVAVGAYHCLSGRQYQLVFPSLPERFKSRVVIELVSLGANRCGVVVGVSTPAVADEQRRKQQAEISPTTGKERSPRVLQWRRFLWEWDLATNSVRFRGPWDGAMTYIAGFLNLGQCEVCWRRLPEGNMKGELKLRDRSSGKTTDIRLGLGIGTLNTDGVTCVPTSSPCALGVCDASDIGKGHLEVRCIDPNAPDGIRWRLDERILKDVVGSGVAGAAFLQNVEPSTYPLPLFVHRIINHQCSSYLLFVDQKMGTVAKQCKMPLNTLYPELPIISPDRKRVVLDVSDLPGTGEQKEDLATDLRTQFRVVDLNSGTFRDTENLYDKLQLCWLHGFLENDRAVLSDEHAIWILDTNGNLRLRELFRLSELASIKNVSPLKSDES